MIGSSANDMDMAFRRSDIGLKHSLAATIGQRMDQSATCNGDVGCSYHQEGNWEQLQKVLQHSSKVCCCWIETISFLVSAVSGGQLGVVNTEGTSWSTVVKCAVAGSRLNYILFGLCSFQGQMACDGLHHKMTQALLLHASQSCAIQNGQSGGWRWEEQVQEGGESEKYFTQTGNLQFLLIKTQEFCAQKYRAWHAYVYVALPRICYSVDHAVNRSPANKM